MLDHNGDACTFYPKLWKVAVNTLIWTQISDCTPLFNGLLTLNGTWLLKMKWLTTFKMSQMLTSDLIQSIEILDFQKIGLDQGLDLIHQNATFSKKKKEKRKNKKDLIKFVLSLIQSIKNPNFKNIRIWSKFCPRAWFNPSRFQFFKKSNDYVLSKGLIQSIFQIFKK